MAGYAALVVLLAGGMTFAIRSFGLQANEQVAHLRAREDEITLAEHLRFLAARPHVVSTAELARRFETELLPRQRELGQALDRFVEHMEDHLKGAYEQGREARGRLSLGMRCLLGFLALSGIGTSWYFATVLARSYRQEQDALDQAQKALAMRDEVMGIVAHDLRNPLNSITMQAALLRRCGELRSRAAHREPGTL